jgi:uncharacterized protein (DUF2141 family)
MNKKISTTIVMGLLLCVFSLEGLAQESPKLLVQITNLKNVEGFAVVNLFREQDGIPKEPFKSMTAAIKNERAEISFNDLPAGSYAAIAYHDENSNGILDHKLGFPNEPMGFSNRWELGLFSGMPTFKKLRFDHDSAETTIEIKVD